MTIKNMHQIKYVYEEFADKIIAIDFEMRIAVQNMHARASYEMVQF